MCSRWAPTLLLGACVAGGGATRDYRSARWSLIADSVVQSDACSPFSGDYERQGTRLIVRLYHSEPARRTSEPACSPTLRDSVVANALAAGDHLASRCWNSEGQRDELLVGVITEPSGGAKGTEPPRVSAHRAWRFDTLAVRIREIKPDGVRCEPEMDPD
jgi:hypothetical protein